MFSWLMIFLFFSIKFNIIFIWFRCICYSSIYSSNPWIIIWFEFNYVFFSAIHFAGLAHCLQFSISDWKRSICSVVSKNSNFFWMTAFAARKISSGSASGPVFFFFFLNRCHHVCSYCAVMMLLLTTNECRRWKWRKNYIVNICTILVSLENIMLWVSMKISKIWYEYNERCRTMSTPLSWQ